MPVIHITHRMLSPQPVTVAGSATFSFPPDTMASEATQIERRSICAGCESNKADKCVECCGNGVPIATKVRLQVSKCPRHRWKIQKK